MTTFSNLKDLEKFINGAIEKALDKSVAPMVKHVMQDNVYEEVYEVYEPKSYDRNMDFGGLSDLDNMVHVVQDGTLAVRNVRKDDWAYVLPGTSFWAIQKDRDVAMIVEYGVGYTYNPPQYDVYDENGNTYYQPRPFTQATRDQIKQHNLHVKELKRALQNMNIDVQ